MTKKISSIVKLAIVAVIVVIGALLTFCSWYVPGTFHKFNSFASSIKLGLDLKGGIYAVYEADSNGVNNFSERLTQTQNRLTDLLTEKGYDPTITTEGNNKLRVEVPDVADPSSIFELIGKPCQVVFVVEDQVVMNAKDKLIGANAMYSSQTGSTGYLVELEFTPEGKNEFGAVTGAAVNKQMSIYLAYDTGIQVGDAIADYGDNVQIVTTANVNEAIYGNATITGDFDQETVENLATQIASGTFELTLSLVESSTMPATLGEQALSTGLIAGAIGLLIVIAFLIWRYRLLGVVATISLAIYTELMFFFLAALPWVQLTLAGIAGIILSLGMAVDGNVIVYERIKEEYRAGKSLLASYHAGFSKAFSSILDGNITTIIAAVSLLIFGAGTIKGFGLTLFVGIVLSMFTSLLLNRFLVKAFFDLIPEGEAVFHLKRDPAVAAELKAAKAELIAQENNAPQPLVVENATLAAVEETAPVEEIKPVAEAENVESKEIKQEEESSEQDVTPENNEGGNN